MLTEVCNLCEKHCLTVLSLVVLGGTQATNHFLNAPFCGLCLLQAVFKTCCSHIFVSPNLFFSCFFVSFLCFCGVNYSVCLAFLSSVYSECVRYCRQAFIMYRVGILSKQAPVWLVVCITTCYTACALPSIISSLVSCGSFCHILQLCVNCCFLCIIFCSSTVIIYVRKQLIFSLMCSQPHEGCLLLWPLGAVVAWSRFQYQQQTHSTILIWLEIADNLYSACISQLWVNCVNWLAL